MAKVEKPLQEPPSDPVHKESLEDYLEDIRRKVNSQGDAVADATGAGDVVAQLNALMDELRDAGFIARS
jgi:hypothetical protein